MYISFFILYGIFLSIPFMLGIGLERIYIKSGSPHSLFDGLAIDVPIVFFITIFFYIFFHYILLPLGIDFLLPLCYVAAYKWIEKLIPNLLFYDEYVPQKEIMLTYGSGFFAIYFSSNFLELCFFLVTTFISFLFFGFLVFTIRKRLNDGFAAHQGKIISLIIISFGFIGFALYAFDFSWIMCLLN